MRISLLAGPMYVLNNRFRNKKMSSSGPFFDAQAHGEDRTTRGPDYDMHTHGLRRLHFCHGRILSTDRRMIPLLEKREGGSEDYRTCAVSGAFLGSLIEKRVPFPFSVVTSIAPSIR